ncbi:hypothetical protein ACX80O_14585 [Arthrobacter sp. Hz1]
MGEYRGVFGDRDGNLAVYLDFDADTVIWRQPHWAGEDDEDPGAYDPTLLLPQIMVFDRTEYEAAMADTERFTTRAGWHRDPPEAAEGDGARRGTFGPVVWLDRLRHRFKPSWDT